jgi:signal transduction histidine kinase
VVVVITAFAVVIAVRAVQLMGGGVVDDAERMRRELVAAVSHDLRTPITSLRLLTDAIADDVVDGDTKRAYLGQISTHLNAMSALIDDLFELSRLEATSRGASSRCGWTSWWARPSTR